jgi:hypothetical protein
LIWQDILSNIGISWMLRDLKIFSIILETYNVDTVEHNNMYNQNWNRKKYMSIIKILNKSNTNKLQYKMMDV